ncbi:hypothetical protein GCM10009787_06730 [Streptomyces bangladeshensis]|uniref:Uncharacterized protein n=1 Tax=Streptomyces bangladeshensis TaxID=295352 RepID=A0ABN3BB40_9ACTN
MGRGLATDQNRLHNHQPDDGAVGKHLKQEILLVRGKAAFKKTTHQGDNPRQEEQAIGSYTEQEERHDASGSGVSSGCKLPYSAGPGLTNQNAALLRAGHRTRHSLSGRTDPGTKPAPGRRRRETEAALKVRCQSRSSVGGVRSASTFSTRTSSPQTT